MPEKKHNMSKQRAMAYLASMNQVTQGDLGRLNDHMRDQGRLTIVVDVHESLGRLINMPHNVTVWELIRSIIRTIAGFMSAVGYPMTVILSTTPNSSHNPRHLGAPVPQPIPGIASTPVNLFKICKTLLRSDRQSTGQLVIITGRVIGQTSSTARNLGSRCQLTIISLADEYDDCEGLFVSHVAETSRTTIALYPTTRFIENEPYANRWVLHAILGNHTVPPPSPQRGPRRAARRRHRSRRSANTNPRPQVHPHPVYRPCVIL